MNVHDKHFPRLSSSPFSWTKAASNRPTRRMTIISVWQQLHWPNDQILGCGGQINKKTNQLLSICLNWRRDFLSAFFQWQDFSVTLSILPFCVPHCHCRISWRPCAFSCSVVCISHFLNWNERCRFSGILEDAHPVILSAFCTYSLYHYFTSLRSSILHFTVTKDEKCLKKAYV